jgi:aminopeptidase
MTTPSPSDDLTILIDRAAPHIRDILTLAFNHNAEQAALVVFDTRCKLARVLAAAYQRSLPEAAIIAFDDSSAEAIMSAINQLAHSDLVVLIQTTSFRLEAFRVRLELFKRSLTVIEHPHLGRMAESEMACYIDSLAYDPVYYRGLGQALKIRIDQASRGVLDSGGESLVFGSAFESAKLNVGDYSQMKNVGGQFPIGEVFTEAKELEAVNGRVRIFAFGDTEFCVNRPEIPITLIIEQGQITATLDSTPKFDQVLANIRADEGVVWVRELGFGLNRAFTKDRSVNDVGTYERMCGVHLSLGAKHGSYNKAHIKRETSRHHVDVFAITEEVLLDDEVIYRHGSWLVS